MRDFSTYANGRLRPMVDLGQFDLGQFWVSTFFLDDLGQFNSGQLAQIVDFVCVSAVCVWSKICVLPRTPRPPPLPIPFWPS